MIYLLHSGYPNIAENNLSNSHIHTQMSYVPSPLPQWNAPFIGIYMLDMLIFIHLLINEQAGQKIVVRRRIMSHY
ncbi:MAG TPA: hypothetical protein VKA98_00910 [Nitrososphaeraceae archaeon]|nr:hypothetical protein [Nitrososphaeraceae archaeon]